MFGIDRIDDAAEAIAAGRDEPVGVADAVVRARAAWSTDREVVLRAAEDSIKRLRLVRRDAVVLRDRQVRREAPRASAIERLVHAAVAADDEMVGGVRVDPNRMVVDVLQILAHSAKGAPAVVGDLEHDVDGVHSVDILRVGKYFVVVVAAASESRPCAPNSRRHRASENTPVNTAVVVRFPKKKPHNVVTPVPRKRIGPRRIMTGAAIDGEQDPALTADVVGMGFEKCDGPFDKYRRP